MSAAKESLKVLTGVLAERGIEIETVKAALKSQAIETPSWAYGDSGTRFHVFQQHRAARNVLEKLEDAALVHRLTGVTPSVAIHVLWDLAEHPAAEVRDCAEGLGVTLGAVNPTFFEQEE